jgi:calcineurin-like phosphoesterase family protein
MKIKEVFKSEDLVFMSDLHYNHENIIKFNNRPFPEGVGQMNSWIESILPQANGKILFDLGDLFWRVSETKMKEVLSITSPSRFYKVLGNHDKEKVYSKSYIAQSFTAIADLLEIKVEHNGKIIPTVLCHYPMVSWKDKPRGAFMLFGHCHGNIDPYIDSTPDLRVDVGLDGSLARSYGSFILPFSAIYDHMVQKAGTDDFVEYVNKVVKEL